MGREREQILSDARDAVLASLPHAWAIYAFGSFARGDESSQSDLDLAVLLPPEQTIVDLLGVIAGVAARTGRDVDLVDLRRAGDVLRHEVLEQGKALYSSAPDQVLVWEASAMSRYGHYREEVRGILEDFERTGIAYAR